MENSDSRVRHECPGSLERLPRLLQCGASAGHVAVMDMMVGNRRGDNTWGRAQVHHWPTITFVSHRRVLYFVMGGPVDSVRDGVLPEGELLRQPLHFFNVVAATLLSLVSSLFSAYGIPLFGLRAPSHGPTLRVSSQHPGKYPERCLKQGQKLGGTVSLFSCVGCNHRMTREGIHRRRRLDS